MNRKYHHIGIPTDVERPDEKYLEEYKVYVSGFETGPFGVGVAFILHNGAPIEFIELGSFSPRDCLP